MTPYKLIYLQLRLKNCLQTILELEPDLNSIELGQIFLKEYEMIKAFLEHLDQIMLIEDDVMRIEQATENFLNELWIPIVGMRVVPFRLRFIQ